jgi:transcriptional regulator with XRE-family HTH domain
MSHKTRTSIHRQKQLGKRIRGLRIGLGWSQKAMAQVAGMNANHLGEIERGKRDFSLTTLKRIAIALNMDGSALFEGIL